MLWACFSSSRASKKTLFAKIMKHIKNQHWCLEGAGNSAVCSYFRYSLQKKMCGDLLPPAHPKLKMNPKIAVGRWFSDCSWPFSGFHVKFRGHFSLLVDGFQTSKKYTNIISTNHPKYRLYPHDIPIFRLLKSSKLLFQCTMAIAIDLLYNGYWWL